MTDTSAPRAADSHSVPNGSPTSSPIDKLAVATQVLLIACGTMSVVTIGIEFFGINAVTVFLNGWDTGIDLLDLYDRSAFAVNILSMVALVAAGVLWAVWQYRAAKAVAGRTRRSARWHAWSWFVPIVSLWFPYQNISDLWHALGRARPSWLGLWWSLWLGCSLVAQVSSRVFMAAADLEQFRDAMWLSIAGEVLLVAATPLACLIVQGITRGARRRAPAPVNAVVI